MHHLLCENLVCTICCLDLIKQRYRTCSKNCWSEKYQPQNCQNMLRKVKTFLSEYYHSHVIRWISWIWIIFKKRCWRLRTSLLRFRFIRRFFRRVYWRSLFWKWTNGFTDVFFPWQTVERWLIFLLYKETYFFQRR